MYLNEATFATVVANTPLVAIDLIIKNNLDQVLLGQRLNRPAKGFWFVPGGRIFKDEPIATAFGRLALGELGQELSFENAALLGNYEHFYKDSIFEDKAISTHYVCLAYLVGLTRELKSLPLHVQHSGYKWFDVRVLLNDPEVHQNTKRYFA